MVHSKYLFLYFHASGEDIKLAHKFLNYVRNSYQANILAMEYPGYSIFPGSPDSNKINDNARVVYDFAVKKLGFQEWRKAHRQNPVAEQCCLAFILKSVQIISDGRSSDLLYFRRLPTLTRWSGQWLLMSKAVYLEFTASGKVQDLHLIPF